MPCIDLTVWTSAFLQEPRLKIKTDKHLLKKSRYFVLVIKRTNVLVFLCRDSLIICSNGTWIKVSLKALSGLHNLPIFQTLKKLF